MKRCCSYLMIFSILAQGPYAFTQDASTLMQAIRESQLAQQMMADSLEQYNLAASDPKTLFKLLANRSQEDQAFLKNYFESNKIKQLPKVQMNEKGVLLISHGEMIIRMIPLDVAQGIYRLNETEIQIHPKKSLSDNFKTIEAVLKKTYGAKAGGLMEFLIPSAHAFTLIELLIVTGVIGILAAIGLPPFLGYVERLDFNKLLGATIESCKDEIAKENNKYGKDDWMGALLSIDLVNDQAKYAHELAELKVQFYKEDRSDPNKVVQRVLERCAIYKDYYYGACRLVRVLKTCLDNQKSDVATSTQNQTKSPYKLKLQPDPGMATDIVGSRGNLF